MDKRNLPVVVLTGTLGEGFAVYGPFPTYTGALDFAERSLESFEIVECSNPAEIDPSLNPDEERREQLVPEDTLALIRRAWASVGEELAKLDREPEDWIE